MAGVATRCGLGAALLWACAGGLAQSRAPEDGAGSRAGEAAGQAQPAQRQAGAGSDVSVARLLAEPQRCAEVAAPSAGVPLTIGSATRAAVCNTLSVRQGPGLATQAQAALDRARGQQQPTLSLSGGIDAERNVSTQTTIALRLDWVLFDFGSRDAGLQQARMALSAVVAEQRTEVLNALADAAVLFSAAQASFGRLDAASVNLRTAQDSARAAEARQGAGAASLAESLQAKTALAQARLEHSRARSQWLSARGALALAIGLHAQEPIELAPINADDAALTEQPINFDALISEAREMHPRVAAARARLAEARAGMAAVEGERWGNLALGARTGRSRASGDSTVGGSTSASLQWTVPLFDRGQQEARLRDAQGQIQQRGVGIDEAMKQVELQIWQQSQALLSEREGLRESRLVLESAELGLKVSTERYRLGVGSFSDVLTAQSSAANARFQVVETRANLRRAQLRLAAAVGRFVVPLGT